jgi:hypothetical protein
MKEKYHDLINILEPFIVCSPNTVLKNDTNLFGKKIGPEMRFNPLSLRSQNFIEKLYLMDQITFGGQGMGMDKWVFFDCAAMPGIVYGYAIKTDLLNDKDRELLNVGKGEYFPVSMYIAIPTLEPDTWFGHNLSSLNKKISFPLSGLGLLTKVSAMSYCGISNQMGATQWDSQALGIHLKISELELLSAYTPIHSKVNTLCYRAQSRNCEEVLNEVVRERSYTRVIRAELAELCQLQEKIELGSKIFLVKLERKDGVESYYIRENN